MRGRSVVPASIALALVFSLVVPASAGGAPSADRADAAARKYVTVMRAATAPSGLVATRATARAVAGVRTSIEPAGSVRAQAYDGYEYVGGLYDNRWALAWGTPFSTVFSHTFHTDDTSMPLYDGTGPGRRDEDFRYFSAVAGRTYEIVVTPTDPVDPADPVLWLFNDPGVDPGGEMWAACDDKSLAFGGDTGCRILYTALETKTTHFAVEDRWETAFDGAGGSIGKAYTVEVFDRGVCATPVMHRPTAPDRYELAAQLAKESLGGSYVGVRHIIIASGVDRAAADPLTSAGLAGVYSAPLLLVRADRGYLPGPTVTAIQQMRTANPGVRLSFHIVGGPASVPDGLKTQILRYAPGSAIDRLGGADRYQVAANVAARMRSVLGAGYPRAAFFVNGRDTAAFWDALMAAPLAFRQHMPILLTTKNSLPAATLTAKNFYATRYGVGMGAELNDSVLNTLGATRIGFPGGAPSDRQILARVVAETAQGWGWVGGLSGLPNIAVTNKLADSLAGGIFMGFRDGVIQFTYDENEIRNPSWPVSDRHLGDINYVEEYLRMKRLEAENVWILGGTASVVPDVEFAVGEYFGVHP